MKGFKEFGSEGSDENLSDFLFSEFYYDHHYQITNLLFSWGEIYIPRIFRLLIS